jgi:hypothetical protein
LHDPADHSAAGIEGVGIDMGFFEKSVTFFLLMAALG